MEQEEAGEQFLRMCGKDLLCFSLSENYDITTMWAYYAENQEGFVLEFDASHPWFANREDPTKTRLHKVRYFDGILDEVLTDPESTFCSKTSHWAHEREWRIYCGHYQIEKTKESAPDPIHLIHFPPDMVRSIIVGSRASDKTIEEIRKIAASRYPLAALWRAAPNNRTTSIDLTSLAA